MSTRGKSRESFGIPFHHPLTKECLDKPKDVSKLEEKEERRTVKINVIKIKTDDTKKRVLGFNQGPFLKVSFISFCE